jgi:hypothetical protein
VQEKRNALRVLLGNPEEKKSPGDVCIDGRKVLKLLQKEQVVRSRTVFTVLRVWTSGRFF